MELIIIIIFLLFLPIFIFLIFPRRPSSEFGFKSYPIVGSLPGLVKNRHRFLDWTVETLSRCPTQTAIFRRPGNQQFVMTANPANVEYMLKTKFDCFPKGERFISLLEDFLGRGIFNSDGDMWWKQRKTASYEFSTRSLRDFAMTNVTVEINTRLVPVLKEASTTGKLIDLQDILERFAFNNICKLAFNVDSDCLGDDGAAGVEFMRAFETAATIISQRFQSVISYPWKIKKKLDIGSERLLRESIVTVHRFADDIVRNRIDQAREENKNEDLLSRFINIEEMNSPELLRDIVISFILAGRDTTSSALSWFFWLLSKNPEVENKIIQELKSIRARTGKRIGEVYGFEDLKLMNYMHAAITESLRLYPPVPVDTMSCVEDNVLPDGTFVGKAWGISYNAYAMGRMESVWGKDCDRFDPERWIDETSGGFRGENPYKFPVFHAGPRMCLGKEMAYIQMKSIVASVMERFVVDVPGKEERPEILLSVTLRIRGGLFVRVHERT
ncbi:hypothetical protein EUTSA_v10005910mg [Eutrema salsugineum]|uniref:Cytochrome P450 n=1 Tax=Eutrema salsugineum TaxID=72664 RepID=V4NEB8_EUTSA|nr:cytochrome P450 94B3 [Eutrema salsugineum]ESQ44421.1 hypothetical protein EUTSA_v10005910mg [Eutrema salsugineum]